MAPRQRVLVTGTIHRADLLGLFDRARSELELSFVEYLDPWGAGVGAGVYAPYGTIHYWRDFGGAHRLLDTVRPDKVVFLANTSLNQVALNQAALARGLRTYHLEHGFRLGESDARATGAFDQRPQPLRSLRRVLAGQGYLIKTHAFFFRSLPQLPAGISRQLLGYASSYYRRGESLELLGRYASLRRHTGYLEFSRGTFAFHVAQDRLPAEVQAQVRFVGIPYFDDLALVRAAAPDPKTVILIDHPLHEMATHPFGWNLTYRHEWVAKLAHLIRRRGLRLLVKLHPLDRSNSWVPHLAPGSIELVDRTQLAAALPSASMVLGTFSTMQLPLAAMRHLAMVVLEIHPEPGYFPGRRLVEAGVAAQVTTFDQLERLLAEPAEVLRSQAPNKERFEAEFLYRFDGHSGERLAVALAE